MEFDIKNLPYKASRLRVTEEISKVLHAHPGHFVTDPKRLPNFEVKLNYQQDVPTRNDGTGTLMVTNDIGRKFYGLYCRGKIRVEIDGRRLTFYPNGQLVEKGLALKLQRARFMDPKIEQKHQQILDTLEDLFLVSKVQIGQLF
ncbi:hypothetical protein ID866_9284 [Astraeus odoratus]|nr:hypothetical protein ID866_9284 [Astraeus odoratus]